MSQPAHTSPGSGRSLYTVAASVWLVIDVAALLALIGINYIFPPSKGLLPDPRWLTDPIAGWLLGNVLGIVGYRLLLRQTPWLIAAICLAFVAVTPVIFVKYVALAAFLSGVAIGVAAGSLFWRAHKHADARVL